MGSARAANDHRSKQWRAAGEAAAQYSSATSTRPGVRSSRSCATRTDERNPRGTRRLLKTDQVLGSLTEGLRADVLVTSTRESDPYRNLITAQEKDVEFVAVNGYPFYGTSRLMKAAGATQAEPIKVGCWSTPATPMPT